VAIVSAFLSLAFKQPSTQGIALAGEITLNGKVLKVDNIKELVLAAVRAGIKKVILPKDNERDFASLPQELKGYIEEIYVSDYSEVFKVMFPTLTIG
jgi:ATP-dependent Lon protease